MLKRIFVECLNCTYWLDSSGLVVAIHENIGCGLGGEEVLSILSGYEFLVDGVNDLNRNCVNVFNKQHFDEVVNDWLYSINGDILNNPLCVVEDYNMCEIYHFFNYLNNYTLM